MLFLNDTIEHVASGARYRVISLDYTADYIWLFDVTSKCSLPKRYSIGMVEQALSDSAMRVVQAKNVLPTRTPSVAAAKARDKAYALIKPLVENPAILHRETRDALIKARAQQEACSPQTVRTHLRAWWANGQVPSALLPAFNKRGSVAGGTSNRGRPPKYEERSIFQVDEADTANIEHVLKDFYLKDDVKTLAATHQELLQRFYVNVDSEGVAQIRPEGNCPTIRQFRRIAKALLPRETVLRRRKGDAEFELNHRPKLGSLQVQTYTVGDMYEIDATIADVFLVSAKNRAAIIGKPTLYLIIDRKSWLIVGFYVGLEAASWPAAMQAILSISEDKEKLCKRYGVPYDPQDWPADGVFPREFVADRGEMLSENSKLIAEGLEVTVTNLPARRADHKPHVECGFKLIHQPIAATVPGYEPPANVTKRQGKHYERDACLTLDEFTAVILAGIVRFNRIPRDGYVLDAAQALEAFQPVPIDIWNHEIRKRAGFLTRLPESHVHFALLQKDQASVSRDGIRLKGCYYSCKEALQRGWMVLAERGAFKVTVSYDRRLVDTIFIHDEQNPGSYFEADLLDKCSDYRGLSFDEVAAIEWQREKLRRVGQQTTRQQNLEFNKLVNPMSSAALAEAKKASKGKSRTARKKDIVGDRHDELTIERQGKAALTLKPAASTSAEVIPFVAKAPTPATDSSETIATPVNKAAQRNARLMEIINGL